MVQIQPREPVRDHADHPAPTRKHELDHTVQTRYLSICLADQHQVKIDYLSSVFFVLHG